MYKFSHLTLDELLAMLTGANKPNDQVIIKQQRLASKDGTNVTSSNVPDAVDWRKLTGAIQGVKNQGNCGYFFVYK